jgi:hypothetical protein
MIPYHSKYQQTYLNFANNNVVRRTFCVNLSIFLKLPLKLSSKLSTKILQALSLLLLPYSWSLNALTHENNRSDGIMLPQAPFVMFVSPSLAPFMLVPNENGDSLVPRSGFLGWIYNEGFFVQSHSSYAFNFPSTGADGLYFDLVIHGDANDVTWDPVNRGGIIVTVTKINKSDSLACRYPYDLDWAPDLVPPAHCGDTSEGYVFMRVTLKGSSASDVQKSANNPDSISKPNLPQTFELVGKNIDGDEVLKYGFVLKQWFVNRGDKSASQSDQNAWCNAIGYRMASVKDLTNAKCGVDSNFPCINDIDGALPQSSDNYLRRSIGAGFFTEWGGMNFYSGADFIGSNDIIYYWTSDNEFAVLAYNGDPSLQDSLLYASRNHYGICAYP